MLGSTSSSNHLEAFALTHLQHESALSIDDDPSDDYQVNQLNAPPATHWSKDRTRRLSRTPTTNSLAPSTKSKNEPTSQFNLSPVASQIGAADSLRFRTVSATPSMSSTDQARHRKVAILHLIALYCALFGEGWNDGSNGPLLPAFQRQYNLSYLIVSLYFVSNCIGFITGGALNMYLDGKIGFGKCIVIGEDFPEFQEPVD
ncbi:hypothetical protein H0H93_014048 [Arthromyces matolae]|nr:hypothetical protein H0H93_014048 [Arthromyces matolae]